MHHVKQRQRHTEHLLEQAERVHAALGSDEGAAHRVREAWDDVLFTSFHDILAGTSVPSVWDSVAAQQGRARFTAEEAIFDATRRAARALPPSMHTQIVAFNADEEAWDGLLEVEPWIDFDEWGTRWVSTPDGEALPYQLIDAESDALMTRVLVPTAIAPRSWATLLVRDDEPNAPPEVLSPAVEREAKLCGGGVEITLTGDGIGRVARDGTVFLEAITLHLREDSTDTWTVHTDRFDEPVATRLGELVWATEEDGPLRARCRARTHLGSSPLELSVSVDQAGRVGVDVLVGFVERFRALQLAFELTAEPNEHEDGVPGGASLRAPGPTEWPVQGWSRVGQLGVVTGDAYSLSLDGRSWCWTLLRSPRMACWPIPSSRRSESRHTDQGEHELSFRLVLGGAESGLLEALARRQLQPPVVFSRYDGVDRPPWGAVPPEKLWTEGERRNDER